MNKKLILALGFGAAAIASYLITKVKKREKETIHNVIDLKNDDRDEFSVGIHA